MKRLDWIKWGIASLTAGVSITVSAFSLFATEKEVDLKIGHAIRESAIISDGLEKRLDRIERKIDDLHEWQRPNPK